MWLVFVAAAAFFGAVALLDEYYREWRAAMLWALGVDNLADHLKALAAVTCLSVMLLVYLAHHVLTQGWPKTQVPQAKPPPVWRRLLALYVTFALLALAYYAFPLYDRLYQGWLFLIAGSWPYVVVLAPFYLMWSDKVAPAKPGADTLDTFGQAIVELATKGQWRQELNAPVGEHWRGWIIKAYFIPIMIASLGDRVFYLLDADTSTIFNSVQAFYAYAWRFISTMDLMAACLGYFITFRMFNTHIRSTDATWSGWLACILCYTPFWSALTWAFFLNYDDQYYWSNWLDANTYLGAFWAGLVLLCFVMNAVSHLAFGPRFSNLTYRGLITSWPYTWTKHPAYLFKNIGWWLIAVPWATNGKGSEPLVMCLLLLGVNALYFWRCRTEERHLSNYPEYVAYGKWMDEHGMFAFITKRIPAWRYAPPGREPKAGPVWWREPS